MVQPWFWAWALLTALFALCALVTAWRAVVPFAVGSALATLLEALHTPVGGQWIAFLSASAALYVALDRPPRYVGRHRQRRG